MSKDNQKSWAKDWFSLFNIIFVIPPAIMAYLTFSFADFESISSSLESLNLSSNVPLLVSFIVLFLTTAIAITRHQVLKKIESIEKEYQLVNSWHEKAILRIAADQMLRERFGETYDPKGDKEKEAILKMEKSYFVAKEKFEIEEIGKIFYSHFKNSNPNA